MDGGLAGRYVLVTGGTGALGTAVVRAFVEAGARVTTSWRAGAERDALVADLGEEAVRLVQADVTDPDSVAALAAAAAPEGRLDVLAQLVGGFAFGPIGETDQATWQRMLALNATSTFLCARAAVGLMRPHRRGRIITVASVPALDRGAANMTAYTASKAAVVGLTQSLAKEVVHDGITVNAIAPTIIDTPANRAAMPKAKTDTWLPPAGIAEAVVWLASDAARLVTGTTLMLSLG